MLANLKLCSFYFYQTSGIMTPVQFEMSVQFSSITKQQKFLKNVFLIKISIRCPFFSLKHFDIFFSSSRASIYASYSLLE